MTKLIIELEVPDRITGKQVAGELISGEASLQEVLREGPYTITLDGDTLDEE